MQQTNFAYEEFRCKNRQEYIIIFFLTIWDIGD